MEFYIPISKINDFLYCPMSLYLHSIYENFYEATYHQQAQVRGKIKHESIDKGTYSSAKRYFTGMTVWCEKYGLMGKIDIYDAKEQTLIERKTKIQKIYQGYIYQLYAQYFALIEMDYKVKNMCIHSLDDNKRYPIKLPDKQEEKEFSILIEKIQNFSIKEMSKHSCLKCRDSIYGSLGW